MLEDYIQEFEEYSMGSTEKPFQKKEKVEFSKPVYFKNETTIIGQPYPNASGIIQKLDTNIFEQMNFMKEYFESNNCEKQRIEWMTISDTEIKMLNFNIKCKIHLTCKSFLQVSLTSFESLDLREAPCAIEIFANSHAEFDHCYFHDCKKASILIRDYSWAKFKNCVFEGNVVSCLIQNNSYAEFENCIFINDKNISIYLNKNSKASLKKCEFKDDIKAIFAKDESLVKIEETNFENCSKGAATISGKSTLMMKNITINDSLSTAIRAIGKSTIKAINVNINNSKGNAINIENGNGYFYKCNISNNTECPTISVRGRYANPIFTECQIVDNGNSFASVIKNCSRPIFNNCTFKNCETNCFSISDFSMPLIKDCVFVNMNQLILNVYGNSKVILVGQISSEKVKLSKNSKIFNEETRNEEQKYTIDETDNNQNNGIRYKSWKPSNYQKVPEMEEFQDPEGMFDGYLKPLTYISIEKIMENENENHEVCHKCCNHNHHDDTEEEELYVSNCGHCLCKNCIHSNCPVCDTKIQDAKKVYFEEQCVICMDRPATTIITSCGHMCMCYECAVRCVEQNFKCPLCNQPILSYRYMLDD